MSIADFRPTLGYTKSPLNKHTGSKFWFCEDHLVIIMASIDSNNSVTHRTKNNNETQLDTGVINRQKIKLNDTKEELIKNGMPDINGTATVVREMVPKLIWEPAILTGYRPAEQPWSYYVQSLFWIHNETGNIWTHVLAPFLTLCLASRLTQDLDLSTNVSAHSFWLCTIFICFTFVVSATAHLFKHKSEWAQDIFMCFDYSGVGFFVYGQFIMNFYCCGNEAFYKAVGPNFSIVIGACALNGVACFLLGRILYPTGSTGRKLFQVLAMALSNIMGWSPVMFRLYHCIVNGNCFTWESNYYHIFSALIFTPLALVAFSLHVPERLYPGQYDIWGHGHQYFHIFVTGGTFTGLCAAQLDLLTTPRDVLLLASPNAYFIWSSALCFIILNMFIYSLSVYYYSYRVKR